MNILHNCKRVYRVFGLLCMPFIMSMVLSVSPTKLSDFFSAPAFAAIDTGKAERGPRFPWASFMRFWNAQCKYGAEITAPLRVKGTYVVTYDHSVSLVVTLKGSIVHTVSAVYANPGLRAGGQQWLKLVSSAIVVGTFRWPETRINAVQQRFRAISSAPAAYTWRNATFERKQTALGWEFMLTFLEEPVLDAE